jgi:hypothetical protein
MPLPIETFLNEQSMGYHDEQNIDAAAKIIHSKMEELLKPSEWNIYKMLFVDHLPEDEIARKMGYRSNETNRKPGYKQLRNIRKAIIDKVKKALKNNEIDIL